MKKFLIYGHSGKMGQEIFSSIQRNFSSNVVVVGENSKGLQNLKGYANKDFLDDQQIYNEMDIIFDFSSGEASEKLILKLEKKLNKDKELLVVIGSTGFAPAVLQRWQNLINSFPFLKIFYAANMSLGVLALGVSAKVVSKILDKKNFSLQILETHHTQKKDAPSGTAKWLLEQTPNWGLTSHDIHSQRIGSVIGEHELRFSSLDEELSISHNAKKRSLFSEGAINYALWLNTKKPGFYTIENRMQEILMEKIL